MPKVYKIQLVLDASAADMAADRQAAKAAAIEKGYDRAAVAAEKQAEREAKATQRAMDQAAKARQKESERQERDVEKQVEKWERGEARKATTAEREAKRSADAQAREAARVDMIQARFIARDLRDRMAYEDRKQKAINKTHDAAVQSMLDQQKGFLSAGTGASDLIGKVTQLGAAYLGLPAAIALLKGLGQAIQEAADHQHKLTEDFLKYRDAQRETAAMRGDTATTKMALATAHFEAQTGMTPEESKAFRAGFMGSGAQYEGNRLSTGDYAKYQETTAKLALVKGIDSQVMGNLAGSNLGFRDYRKVPDAPRAAASDLNQAIEILMHGKGENSSMARQLEQLSSANVNEDETKGTFKSAKDAAVALSVMAEYNPEESFTYVQAAIRGLREKKSKGLRDEAKIGPQTDFFDAMKQMAPVIEQEAKTRGVKNEDVIAEHFSDIRTQRAIGVMLSRGVTLGLIDERKGFAATKEGPAVMEKSIADSYNDPDSPLPNRLADARQKEVEARKGSERATLRVIQKQAETHLDKNDALNSEWAKVSQKALDLMSPMAWFGMEPNARQNAINQTTVGMLKRRAEKAGVDLDISKYDENQTPLQVEKQINSYIKELQAKGVNVTGEEVATPARPAGVAGRPGAARPVAAKPAAGIPHAMNGGDRFGISQALAASALGAVGGRDRSSLPPVFDDDAMTPSAPGAFDASMLAEVPDLLRQLIAAVEKGKDDSKTRKTVAKAPPALPAPRQPIPGGPFRA